MLSSYLSWLLHLFLEEALAEINVWQESRTVLTAEIEIELLAELTCALKYALETRLHQVREFALSILLLRTPQMPKGLEYMEQEFIKDYGNNSINRLRLSLICGTIFYIIFGLIDPISLPSNYIFAWIIRYSAVLIFLVIIVLTFTNSGERHIQLISCLSTVISGFGIIGMIGVSVRGEIGYNNYYSGVVLVILWANTTTCLRFIHSAIFSSLIVLGYWGVAIVYQNVFEN